MSSQRFYFALVIAIALMLIHAHADYLLQAYQHGWATWLDLHGRAMKWPWYLDLLPRDPWHLVQSVRNMSVIISVALVLRITYRYSWEGQFALTRVGRELYKAIHTTQRWMWSHRLPCGTAGTGQKYWNIIWFVIELGIPLLLYGVTRGIGFSLAYAVMN